MPEQPQYAFMLIKTHRVPLRGNPGEKGCQGGSERGQHYECVCILWPFHCFMFHVSCTFAIINVIYSAHHFRVVIISTVFFNILLYADLKVSQHDIYVLIYHQEM